MIIPLVLDIETTGLEAPHGEVISVCLGDKVCCQDCKDVDEVSVLSVLYRWIVDRPPESVIVTYNGGTFYNPGFDFPFLRTRYAIQKITWPFAGVKTVDIFPIIQKRFNTAVSINPELSDITVPELTKMYDHFDLGSAPKTKAIIIQMLRNNVDESQISKYLINNCESKRKDINTLKGAYELLTGKPAGDMNGAESVKLWLQYKETLDSHILDQIRDYNKADCDKTLELYEILRTMVSWKDMNPEAL